MKRRKNGGEKKKNLKPEKLTFLQQIIARRPDLECQSKCFFEVVKYKPPISGWSKIILGCTCEGDVDLICADEYCGDDGDGGGDGGDNDDGGDGGGDE